MKNVENRCSRALCGSLSFMQTFANSAHLSLMNSSFSSPHRPPKLSMTCHAPNLKFCKFHDVKKVPGAYACSSHAWPGVQDHGLPWSVFAAPFLQLSGTCAPNHPGLPLAPQHLVTLLSLGLCSSCSLPGFPHSPLLLL